jgi:hypothetical protein
MAGVPLEVSALDLAEVNELYERRLVLVRPDGHVAWRADEEPADARALIEVVRGASSCGSLRQNERATNDTSVIASAAQRGGRP